MVWWMAIPAVVSAVGAVQSYNSGQSSNSAQRSAAEFNAAATNTTNLQNIFRKRLLTQYNNEQMAEQAKIQTKVRNETAQYNLEVLQATADYNDALMAEDLVIMYDSMNLDLFQLGQQRQQERGGITAVQAASGTLINEDSNADVILNSMAQEAMDTLIVKRNADISASAITNARAQGAYNAKVAASQIVYDNRLGSMTTAMNTATAIQGANFQMNLEATAGVGSSLTEYAGAMSAADTRYDNNQTQLTNGLANGLFSAAGQGVSAYYQVQSANVNAGGNWWESAPQTSTSIGGSVPAGASSYTYSTGYTGNYTL